MRMSIKNKIALSISGVVLVVGVLATVTIFFVSRNQFIDYEKRDLAQIALRSNYEVERFFQDQRQFVAHMAEQPELREYLIRATTTPGDAEVLDVLKKYHLESKFSAIYLMDSIGETLVSTNPDFTGKNYGFRPYFQSALRGEPGLYMAVGQTSKEAGYYFSHPIRAGDQVAGVVVSKLKPGVVAEVIRPKNGRDKNGVGAFEFMFVDKTGVIIAATSPEKRYKSLGELNLNKEEQQEIKDRFSGITISSLGYERALRRLNTSGSLDIRDKKTGEQKLLEINNIENTPYTLILEAGTRRVFDYVYNISFALAGFVLFSAMLSVFIIYLLVWWFLKPLYQLERAIKEVNEGDYEINIDINTGDEWEYLANSFNKLTTTLAWEKKNVEQKVNESTKRLRKINKTMMGRELKMKELKEENQELKKRLKNKKKK